MPRLRVLEARTGAVLRELAIATDEVTIGRDRDNTVVIPGGRVSRRHARILATDRGYLLADADSANGVWVGEQRIRHHFLTPGEVFRIGDAAIEFQDDEPRIAQPPVPAALEPGTTRCARCGAAIPPRSDRCAHCGTGLFQPPRPRRMVWMALGLFVGAFGMLALGALGWLAAKVLRDRGAAAPTVVQTMPTPPPTPPPPATREPAAGASPSSPGAADCPEQPRVQRKCPWTPDGFTVAECRPGYCWDGGPEGSFACRQEDMVANAERIADNELVCRAGFTPRRDPCTKLIQGCVAGSP